MTATTFNARKLGARNMSQGHHNPSGDSTMPPETGLTDTPRKPWAKPTVRVIGETVHDTQAGSNPAYAESSNPLDLYAPTS